MFFSIPNLSSLSVAAIPEPWAFVPTGVPENVTKAEYRDWCVNLNTRHAFISAYEGMSPYLRVNSSDNPPIKMHGLVVDYDSVLSDDAFEHVRKHPGSEFFPTWGCRTFSNNGRLIWEFERPLLISNRDQLKKFILLLNKKLVLRKWLAGLETEALANPEKYYDIGHKWERIGDGPVSNRVLTTWLWEASKELRLIPAKYEIPMERIAAEVHAKFPGRWAGVFDVGARGVRFWDPTANDPTGAIVHKDGMMAFSGEQAFLPWVKILGTAFVNEFESSRIAEVMDKVAWDGKAFWIQHDGSARWTEMSREDMTQWLRVHGVSGAKAKGETCSDLDRVEVEIKLNRRVKNAFPYIHHPTGLIEIAGDRVLNTWDRLVMTPAAPFKDSGLWSSGAERFPFIRQYLKNLFTDSASPLHTGNQLEAVLAWLAYFYRHAYAKTPKPGQALILAGPPNVGKTLFSRRVVGALAGGMVDASSYLVDGSPWTEHVVEAPVLAVDDSTMLGDHRTILAFSSKLKKLVANQSIMFNGKFKKAGDIPFFGRIVVTANTDAESLRILPDMDMSTKDKISLFLSNSDTATEFPARDELDVILSRELPMFARFLLDYQIPESQISGEKRFGIKSFHHPALFAESINQGQYSSLTEAIIEFLSSYEATGRPEYRGTGIALYRDMAVMFPDLKTMATPQRLGAALSQLEKRGFGVKKEQLPGGHYEWVISFEFTPEERKHSKGAEHVTSSAVVEAGAVHGSEQPKDPAV